MAKFTDHRGWTDLQPHSKFLPPNVVIPAEDFTLHGTNSAASDMYLEGMTRKVVYKASNGQKYYMELSLYVHPVGAGALNLTVGGVATAESIGVSEGRFLLKTGALSGAGARQDAIAGVMLAPYYDSTTEFTDSSITTKAGALAEGDGIWLVRRGRIPLDAAAGAVAAGTVLNTAVSGEVAAAAAMPTGGGTVTANNITIAIEQNSFAQSGKAVGIMRATSGTGLLAVTDAEVLLGPSYLFDTV